MKVAVPQVVADCELMFKVATWTSIVEAADACILVGVDQSCGYCEGGSTCVLKPGRAYDT